MVIQTHSLGFYHFLPNLLLIFVLFYIHGLMFLLSLILGNNHPKITYVLHMLLHYVEHSISSWLVRNGRTYWCDSRICKKACKNKMVIYETYLSMDAWTNGQFNIVGMAEKFWTRNNTYYVIQFNPSCFRKQQYKFTFYFVCMLPKPSKTFNKFFKKVSLWFTCFTLKSVNCFQTWGVNSHKKALLQNP